MRPCCFVDGRQSTYTALQCDARVWMWVWGKNYMSVKRFINDCVKCLADIRSYHLPLEWAAGIRPGFIIYGHLKALIIRKLFSCHIAGLSIGGGGLTSFFVYLAWYLIADVLALEVPCLRRGTGHPSCHQTDVLSEQIDMPEKAIHEDGLGGPKYLDGLYDLCFWTTTKILATEQLWL